MKHVPFNTGKVRIGLAYQPRTRSQMSRDEENLQAALLSEGKPSYLGLLTYASILAAAIAAVFITH